MSDQIKDPLGVVQKWRDEEAGAKPSDDVKYPLLALALGIGLIAGAVGIIWTLSLLF